MKSYSQRDPLWSIKQIPGTSLTLGRYGCTITCIADLSTYFGYAYTPPEILSLVSFTPDGRIIWSTLNVAGFSFEKRFYGRDNSLIIAALRDPDTAAILQVAGGSHWCVATGWQVEIKDFKIADPWLGDWSNMARYNFDITGFATFKRK